MTPAELDNLVRTGQRKREAPNATEIAGLRHSAEARLMDARRMDLSLESRFDLAYNAAHAFSLAALRLAGSRSGNRYIVFQTLSHTVQLPTATWRVLAKCHGIRNQAEYEGLLAVDERLVEDLVAATAAVRDALNSRHPSARS